MRNLTLAALALLPAAAPAAAIDWAKAPRINVAVASADFTPNRILMRSGRPYVLVFRNPTDRAHDLTADGFFGNARLGARDRGKVAGDRLAAAPHSVTTLRLWAPRAAIYRFHCSKFGHIATGEKGEIVVR